MNLFIPKILAQTQDNLPPIHIRNWGIGNLQALSRNIISILLIIVSVAAVLAIIYGGYLYMTSGGNPERAGQGKNAVLGAIIGLVISFAAYAIIQYVRGVF